MVLPHLPNEILAHIFLLGTLDWQENTPSELPFPILVSCLCQHWRLVAHHNPRMWCTISPPQFQLNGQEGTTKWVQRWLARAGNLPISIVAYLTPWCPQKQPQEFTRNWSNITAIVEAIISCPERIRSLDIRSDYSNPTILKEKFSNLPVLPNLRELSLQLPAIRKIKVVNPHHQEFKETWGWFRKFPNLKAFRSDGVLVPALKGLTTLSFRHAWLAADMLRTLLSSLPQLETLLLPTVSVLGSSSVDKPAVRARSLRRFAIDLNDADMAEGVGDHSTNIFEQIRLPRLRYLELRRTPHLAEAFFDGIKQRFERLETVHFSNPGTWSDCNVDPVMVPALSSLSNLRHLRFVSTRTAILNPSSHPSTSTSHNDAGAGATSSTTLWPNVSSITLFGSVRFEDFVDLCKFVKSHKSMEVVSLDAETKHWISKIAMYGDELDMQEGAPVDGQAAEKGEPTGNVEEWLLKMVRVEAVSECDGLLDGEGLNLEESSSPWPIS